MLEGRKALPKAIQPLVSRRMESFLGDRSHRQVIESIRSGNNDDFFEAMEGGMFVCMYVCLCMEVYMYTCMYKCVAHANCKHAVVICVYQSVFPCDVSL